MRSNIEDYLLKKEKALREDSKRLKDPRVFDFNFIPERPVMRDELKAVIDGLLRYSETGVPNHLLLAGARGCGKTLSVLYLRQMFQERGLKVLYANCRFANTSYKILATLLETRARGVSFDELALRFADAFPERTVIILDEVELLSERDKNQDILYFLSRSRHNYMTILLSNDPRWLSSIDESVASSLQPELVLFRPYSVFELSNILLERARAGVRQVQRTTLNEMSALTYKYAQSDVRIAIKTLYYCAIEPTITLHDNFERARRDVVLDVLHNLSDKNLVILMAIAQKSAGARDVYDRYTRLCVCKGEEPFSYVHFNSSLAHLQSLGLILLTSLKVKRAYTRLAQLTFPREPLDTIWQARFM